jgi:hypothetical protein
MADTKEEIKEVLSNPGELDFEFMQEEGFSPLNEPLEEKYKSTDVENPPNFSDNDFSTPDEELDAPEQEIGEEFNPEQQSYELPTEQAQQAADALIGVTDNVLEIGGGYFVKIKKHQLFYDFEEIIQVVDQQNEKNVQRVKLDEQDKILLRPLLVAVLKKRAKHLSPEQQLLGAVLSILFKKVQLVFEIRAENELLLDRILQIIKEEKEGKEEEEKTETIEEVTVEEA